MLYASLRHYQPAGPVRPRRSSVWLALIVAAVVLAAAYVVVRYPGYLPMPDAWSTWLARHNNWLTGCRGSEC